MRFLGLVGRKEMARVREHHQLRSRNLLGEDSSVLCRDQLIRLAVNHERRRRDFVEPLIRTPFADRPGLPSSTTWKSTKYGLISIRPELSRT